MQHIYKYFSRKNKVETRIDISDNDMKRNDSLFLLPSIKNNIGNFRKLTHVEITYIEEMLNIEELIELIKVYDDCITLILDTKSFKSQVMYVKG
jgi:hypothetical protein